MDVINSLLRAARAGNLKRVVEFIEDDLVDINASNQNGLTALHSASKEGHQNVVEELISRGANVHAKTLKGNTALHIASLAGHANVVKVLVENGADVDAQSASGFTALYMAAQENHEAIVRYLLINRANQNIATTDGFTPLAVAMQQGHEQIASILLSNEAKGRIRFPGTTESGRSLFHIAAKKDDCAAAALLMQNNISPDLTSKSGFTALHVASHYGNENIAKLLIDRQADVNFQAKHNITPLHVAAKWGRENLVGLLLDNNARIDATTHDGLTPLHCAARSGHDLVVEDLIKRGAPISAKTRSGLAPLHMATQGDHLRSAQILLNNRAPVDDVTVDYLTALHVASHCGHVKVAKLLLNNKADPNFRALNGFTSLHIACKKDRLEVVKLLLKYGGSLNTVTESGLTPLHVASFMGCVQIVIYLLDNHANIDSMTVRGETPLHLATRANQIEVIRVLLRYGANVGARAKESQTALHIAARLGNADIAKLLIQQGIDVDAPTKDSYTALHIAAKEGHDNVVAVLLDHITNISCATRNHGFTPLHLAAKYGIDGVVDLLLRYGAPVDAQGKNGVTPLHVATHYDHPNVVQLLLQNRGPRSPGASPHAMAKNGYTALHIAAKDNRLDIANALLQYGANPNAESKAGFCPLHLAAQEGRADMAALLLNNRAAVDCRAKNGITPLHLCAQEDNVNVAQLLVKRGADLDTQTKGGFTPLHFASHFARIKMIKFLLANGANVNISSASGYTPLHQASQQGNQQIVELLLQYNAKPDALTESGQTALSIAQNLGYVSIIDTLKVVTETVVKTTTMTITEEKFKIVAPETMQETFFSDSEDEADDFAHAESVKFLTTDVMKNFNTTADDYHTSQSNLMGTPDQASGQQRLLHGHPGGQQHDEMSQDLNYLSREAPLDGGESAFGGYSQLGAGGQRDESVLHMGSDLDVDERHRLDSPTPVGFEHSEQVLNQLSPDNVDIQRPLQQAGSPIDEQEEQSTLQLKPFLVSFMVDARGGAMRGCRHSGVRVIIPPNSAPMPMRITCRYLRRERLVHPPPLMEGEACASKIMEVGPAGAKFLGPVLIEVPHFASLRGKEREIIILRSDNGEVWREHLMEADERLVDSIIRSAADDPRAQSPPVDQQENIQPASSSLAGGAGVGGSSSSSSGDDSKRRLTRIVTNEFPQYFAIISRIRQEVHAVGPEGSAVSSQVVPRVQAIFTEGALTKRIKIGLQPKGGKQQDQSADKRTASQELQQNGFGSGDRSPSPVDGQQQLDSLSSHERAVSPGGSGQVAQPSSAAAKRRSRFLACFGGGHGSVDLLEDGHEAGESSSGGAGDSPRQPAKEKLVQRRFILGDVSDSEGEGNGEQGSPTPPWSLSGERVRTKRHIKNQVELVPENYYIEHEPPLILNVEPMTYGKRLASSSAQTDAKLNGHLPLSTKKKPPRSGGGGLCRGRRKHKYEMTIHCDGQPRRPKSTEPSAGAAVADSSLDTTIVNGNEQAAENDKLTNGQFEADDDISLIQDAFTSEDQKWRTCTIQTDSDSVTVNYVTIAGDSASGNHAAASSGPTSGQDDGYVSGSGDLNKAGTFGKGGLFGLPCGGASVEHELEGDKKRSIADEEAKAARKQKQAKSSKKANNKKSTAAKTIGHDEQRGEPTVLIGHAESPEPKDESLVETTITTTTNDDQPATITSDASTIAATTRSVSPTSKELKQKQKLERQERLKREKEEKRLQKELDEAAARAEKAKKKQEKELKKAEKAAQKWAAKKSPPDSPQPIATATAPVAVAVEEQAASAPKSSSVKFASTLVETSSFGDLAQKRPNVASEQLDSIQRVVETMSESYEKEKERLSQEDGHDMVRVSISERIGQPAGVAGDSLSSANSAATNETEPKIDGDEAAKLISFSDSEEPSKSQAELSLASRPEISESVTVTTATAASSTNLKPILKQQSTVSSGDEVGAEIVIGDDGDRKIDAVASQLVREATEDAVRAAEGAGSPGSEKSQLSKKELVRLSKEEKERQKREAKLKLDEEKRVAKEIKEAKKLADAEAKRAVKEAKAEAVRLAKEEKKRHQEELKLAKKQAKGAQLLVASTKTSAADVVDASKQKPSSPSMEQPIKSSSEDSSSAKARAASKQEQTAISADVELVTEPKLAVDQEIDGEGQKSVTEVSSTPVVKIDSKIARSSFSSSSSSSSLLSSSDLEDASKAKALDSKAAKKKKDKAAKKKEKEAKKKKKQEAKAPKGAGEDTIINTDSAIAQGDASEISEPTASSSKAATGKSQGFFSRFFGGSSNHHDNSKGEKNNKKKSKSGAQSEKPVEASEAKTMTVSASDRSSLVGGERKQSKERPVIMSEMYPSDPDDIDGEMILEVNVPKNLIETREVLIERAQRPSGGDYSQASDTAASPTLATTIDESLITTDDHGNDFVWPIKQSTVTTETITTAQQHADTDQEATLVNVSQMQADDDEEDDDATENLFSQATNLDLAAAALTEPEQEPQHSAVMVKRSVDEPEAIVEVAQVTAQESSGGNNSALGLEQWPAEAASKPKEAGEDEDKRKMSAASQKDELKDEKARKELEVKLEKEAKKRAKEESARAKKLAKEEESRAKAEAKRRAKEEKKRAKEDAKEAKKQLKQDKKDRKKREKEAAKMGGATVGESGVSASEQASASQQAEQQQESSEFADTSNMTPVNTETEVQHIVEEVLGDDGVVTKTTKTIETKYVTMRQEEIKMSERRDMPLEEYARRHENGLSSSIESLSSSNSSNSKLAEGKSEKKRKRGREHEVKVKRSASPELQQAPGDDPSGATQMVKVSTITDVPPYEHAELDAIRSIPSYFEAPADELNITGDVSPKRELKKRIKLNEKLIKRAFKLAKSETKKAKKQARVAESEIANCDEAVKEARKELKHAVKEARRAAKLAAKEHKKMDKVDKKLAKRQKKIEKKQRKIDKRSTKLEEKEQKKREKLAKKEAKQLERQASQKSSSGTSSSRKSIKLEDIGAPVLRSSSRDLAQQIGAAQNEMVSQQQQQSISHQMAVIERVPMAVSDRNVQVEMPLDDGQVAAAAAATLDEAAAMAQKSGQHAPSGEPELIVSHTITTTTSTELPGGEAHEQVEEQVLTGAEALAAIERLQERQQDGDEDEEIDVLSKLPTFERKRGEAELAE